MTTSQNEPIAVASHPVGGALLSTATKAFYIGSDTTRFGRSVVTVHAAKSVVSAGEMTALATEMRTRGLTSAIRLRRHSDKRLARARSIESFVKMFGHAKSLHDATGAIDRGHALVAFSRAMRAELGSKLAGLYWNPRWRTAYIVLDHKHFIRNGMLREAELAAMEEVALRNLVAATSGLGEDFKPALRLSFEMPSIALVPIDARSQATRALLSFMRSRSLMIPALGAMIGFGSVGAAAAAEDTSAPAVSAINGKIAIMGNYSDTDSVDDIYGGIAAGSLTIPGDHRFGVQFDGVLGADHDSHVAGIGGHFFWRDPTSALVGLTGSYVVKNNDSASDQSASRLGAEGELYLDQFTVSARGGYQFGSNVDDGTYSGLDISWYATDNLKFSVGAANDPQFDTTGRAGIEFQPGLFGVPGLSFFADGAVGDDGFATASVGVRFYFGDKEKTLKDRHRYDDPEENLALNTFKSISGGSVKSNYTAPYET